jgi:hypothetical protein
MSNPPDIKTVVNRFVQAFNSNDASLAPLADDVVYSGPLMPEPLRGEQAVRQHIAEIAPFVARLKLKWMITEADSVAAIFEFEGVNGVVTEGAEFFRLRDGLICEDRVFFDTRPLIQGRG